jgi:hypothetical protein
VTIRNDTTRRARAGRIDRRRDAPRARRYDHHNRSIVAPLPLIRVSDDGPADRPIRLVVVMDLGGDPVPSELRDRFVGAVQAAIMRAAQARGVPLEVAEELWRAIPAAEPRQ